MIDLEGFLCYYKPMFRKILLIFLVTFAFCLCVSFVPLEAQMLQPEWISSLEPIEKNDRVLILAPHPDDEAIGCAGIILQALKAGADTRVAYLTNGDHNQVAFIVYEKRITLRQNEFIHMGKVRKEEAIKAMELLGLGKDKLVFLGYPDFGTFSIFSRYWQSKKPYRSLLTRISKVPYKEDLSYEAPYVGESILADLKTVLSSFRPNKIFVSHPADVNVDHKSFYLFLQVALADLHGLLAKPKIYPYLIHCVGWPLPRHYHPELALVPPARFLDAPINWFKYDLSKEELDKKYASILCYRSQTQSSAFYLLSFARKNELFGIPDDVYLTMPYVKSALDRHEPMAFKDRVGAVLGLSKMFGEKEVDMIGVSDETDKDPGKVSYNLDDRLLIIKVRKPRQSIRRASTSIYLFGYSYKVPFAQMPKVRIVTRYTYVKAFDKDKIIGNSGIKLELAPEELIIKVPLKTLKDPDFILSSVKAYTGEGAFQSTGFRRVNIRRSVVEK